MFASSFADRRCSQLRGVDGRGSVRTCPRRVVIAYATPPRIRPRIETPREILGVSHDADAQEIKTAFRKLALRYHPDRTGGDEEQFIQILRAYEILAGKTDGKEIRQGDDWAFHDWYWKFKMHRSREGASATGRFQADVTSQLAGLRQRAAVRATRARAEQSVSPPPSVVLDGNFEDTGDSPADSGVTSETATFDQSQRYFEEARRRARLSSSDAKESISNQLTGLKRRAQLRNEL